LARVIHFVEKMAQKTISFAKMASFQKRQREHRVTAFQNGVQDVHVCPNMLAENTSPSRGMLQTA
jgi:hypothetical protein